MKKWRGEKEEKNGEGGEHKRKRQSDNYRKSRNKLLL